MFWAVIFIAALAYILIAAILAIFTILGVIALLLTLGALTVGSRWHLRRPRPKAPQKYASIYQHPW